MTFEEAKQQVAESFGYLTPPYNSEIVVNEAAELWQQSNLERIKELEDGLKSIIHKYKNLKESRVSNDAYNRQFKGLCTDFILEAKELLK